MPALRLSLLALAALALSGSSSVAAQLQQRSSSLAAADAHALVARVADAAFNSAYLASNYQNGSAPPNAREGDAAGQTVILSTVGGSDDDSQVPDCSTIFIGSAVVAGSADGGWQALPQLVGFELDRSLVINGATQPLYIENTKDYTKIKRVIIGQPGKPRDAWKYSNLFRNSLICAVANSSVPTTLADVLIAAPMWLDEEDAQAGAAQSTDLYWSNGGWSVGSQSRGPNGASVSTFEVMDRLIDRFLNTTEFPAVTSIIVAGHSLGASFAQRYAMLRKPTSQDASISFWVGNPGAYVWPTSERPVQPASSNCSSSVDEWAYGIGGSLPAYRISDVNRNKTGVYQEYFGRRVQYALGLEDDGPGDTHCEAQYQGSSHLERGQNMEKALDGLPGGKPASHTFNYVPNTSHEDYKMMANAASQDYLFAQGIDQPRQQGASATSTSSGSGSGSGSSRGGSSTSSGSGSGGSGSSSGGSSGAASLSAASVFSISAAAAGLVLAAAL